MISLVVFRAEISLARALVERRHAAAAAVEAAAAAVEAAATTGDAAAAAEQAVCAALSASADALTDRGSFAVAAVDAAVPAAEKLAAECGAHWIRAAEALAQGEGEGDRRAAALARALERLADEAMASVHKIRSLAVATDDSAASAASPNFTEAERESLTHQAEIGRDKVVRALERLAQQARDAEILSSLLG